MTIRAIIWDLGGVLLRTEDRQPRREAAARLGLTYEQLEDLVFNSEVGRRAQLGLATPADVWEAVRQAHHLAPEELSRLQQAFFAGDRIDRALVEYIRSLRPRYKVGVISNAWNNLDDLLARERIAGLFDHVVGSGDVGLMKPDPRIYRLSLQGLAVAAPQAVFIDDNPSNVEGARAVGMQAIHFLGPQQALRDLENLLNHRA
jgi:epoxide hydrolase-like predicted phosphatase